MTEESQESLPFSEKKQTAVLGFLITREQFFLQARTRIRPEWFVDAWNARIWKAYLSYFERLHRAPLSIDEFKSSREFVILDNAEKIRLHKQVDLACITTSDFGLDDLRLELTDWLQSRLIKANIEKVVDLFNASAQDPRKLRDAIQLYKGAARDIDTTSFEQETTVSFEDIVDGSFWQKRQLELTKALTFGCPALDQKLNRNCVGNASLLRGDHTIVLAPTNVGKTSCLVSVVRHNLERKSSVLWVTHEGVPGDLKAKLIQCISGRSSNDCMDYVATPEGQKYFSRMHKHILEPFLVYAPINRPGLTVEDVEAVIRRHQERRLAMTGKGYDLIIDDYPAKLTTQQASKGNMQKRSIDEHVYNFFTQIGLEFNCHILTAIQTNREGSKINAHRQKTEHRLLGMEDVAESWGAMTTATNVITINRDDRAATQHRLTFHICKSRSNETGWSIVTKTNFGLSLTHGGGLKATAYRGNNPMHDLADDLIAQHDGGSLPEHFYHLG